MTGIHRFEPSGVTRAQWKFRKPHTSTTAQSQRLLDAVHFYEGLKTTCNGELGVVYSDPFLHTLFDEASSNGRSLGCLRCRKW